MPHTLKQSKVITSIDQLDLNGTYTYADYVTWQFSERVELILGKIFKMSPAPSSLHQEISSNLNGIFYNYLKKKKCKVFPAPFDVRLPNPNLNSGKIINVVQPDLCVICDLNLVDEAGCKGAPDLIIEILSTSTSNKDKKDKFELYEKNRVKEYWMIEPFDKTVMVYTLDDQHKLISLTRPLNITDKIKVTIFKDLMIDLAEVFDEKKEIK